MGECGGVRLKFVQAAIGAQPDHARGAEMDSVDHIIAQAVGVSRIVLETGERFIGRVKSVQAVVRAGPDDAGRVFADYVDA